MFVRVHRIQAIPDYVPINKNNVLRGVISSFASANTLAMQVIQGRVTFSGELERIFNANDPNPTDILAIEECLGARGITDYFSDAQKARKGNITGSWASQNPSFVLSEYQRTAAQLDEAVSSAYKH